MKARGSMWVGSVPIWRKGTILEERCLRVTVASPGSRRVAVRPGDDPQGTKRLGSSVKRLARSRATEEREDGLVDAAGLLVVEPVGHRLEDLEPSLAATLDARR